MAPFFREDVKKIKKTYINKKLKYKPDCLNVQYIQIFEKFPFGIYYKSNCEYPPFYYSPSKAESDKQNGKKICIEYKYIICHQQVPKQKFLKRRPKKIPNKSNNNSHQDWTSQKNLWNVFVVDFEMFFLYLETILHLYRK